ncbi:synaptotagmin-5 isoform X2 [Macrosteles quadrilineatus]|uniref:synaptotagmin-5 isoform X2 n=1 Tax=Macrosteles quadrilineatus TaxID=74068 RepID=UPI0023E13880|nr:synaptotagmin-5 isoform X2 [Macrosteles quadrilineatus]
MALYGVVSFVVVLLGAMLMYVACSKRYRLNWFEKNLLESADVEFNRSSQEALVTGSVEAMTSQDSGSRRSLNRSPSQDKFWVPPNLQRQSSVCQSEASSNDDSPPGSPRSPTPSQFSGGAEPLVRNDKQVVLTTTRPRVSSMHTKLDHTKIDTTLYQSQPARSSSEPEELRGSVHLTLTYDPAAGILTIRLNEAHDLQARDFSGTADPYAKIRLLPDRTNVWQTRIHKRTLNPVFDEDFVFEVRPAALGRRTLEIILYDFDAYSRHHSIGGVKLPLANIDLSDKVSLWKGLGPCSEQDSKAELGELMVSLAYLPSAERLTVVVIKARNLRVVDDTRSSSDPYVKVSLITNGRRLKRKKTSVHRNTVSPVFNEALTFDISKDALTKCRIEFNVMHDSLLGPSESLGRAMVSQETEKHFYNQMLTSKTATAQWLALSDPE